MTANFPFAGGAVSSARSFFLGIALVLLAAGMGLLKADDMDVIAPLVRGNLIALKDGQPAPYPDANLKGIKYYGIFYSAYWCPDCRRFTPDLVNFYNQTKPHHPEFELLWVSMDKDASQMEQFMEDMSMPWPAVTYAAGGGSPYDFQGPGIRRFQGNYIPRLLLVSRGGKVLLDGGEDMGGGKILDQITGFLAHPPG